MFKTLLNSLTKDEIKKLKSKSLIIGVSGGPDSIYLLHFLSFLKNKKVVVCMVDYSIRKNSKQEFKYVNLISNKLNYRFFGFKYEQKLKKNIQDHARRIRFDFFLKIMKKTKINLLLLGSTMNDLVESFYMNLISNKNTPIFQKITLMNAHNFKYTIFRPLIFISKDTLLNELRSKQIKYFIDKTNKENIYLRNKIRNLITYKTPFNQIIRIINVDNILNAWVKKISLEAYVYLKKNKFSLNYYRELNETIQVSVLRIFLVKEIKAKINLRNLGNRVYSLNAFLNNKKNKGNFRISPTVFISKKNKLINIICI